MRKEQDKAALWAELQRILPDVSRETFDKFAYLAQQITKWQKLIQLVSKQDLAYLWQRHIFDSIQFYKLAAAKNSWLDLGSGGGFPGLVIAIILRDIAQSQQAQQAWQSQQTQPGQQAQQARPVQQSGIAEQSQHIDQGQQAQQAGQAAHIERGQQPQQTQEAQQDRQIEQGCQTQPAQPDQQTQQLQHQQQIQQAKACPFIGDGGSLDKSAMAACAKQDNKTIYLVESNQKKASFLQNMVSQLDLPAYIYNERIEIFSQNLLRGQEQITPEVITARALAPLERLCHLTYPFFAHNSQAIALFAKGRNYQTELQECQKKWHFTLKIYPNQIDKEGVILQLSNLSKIAN